MPHALLRAIHAGRPPRQDLEPVASLHRTAQLLLTVAVAAARALPSQQRFSAFVSILAMQAPTASEQARPPLHTPAGPFPSPTHCVLLVSVAFIELSPISFRSAIQTSLPPRVNRRQSVSVTHTEERSM